MTSERPAWLAMIVVAACARGGAPIPAAELARDSPGLEDACRLTGQRCTRCHSIDRVLLARLTPSEWTGYVRRMRLMPGSGIPPAEEPILVRCLAFRSPRASGIAVLARQAGG
jgi:hypothetical protein